MTTATLEKQSTVITYPEIPYLPKKSVGFCPLLRGTVGGWPPDMPPRVQMAIAKAVPVFGMSIQVFYPRDSENSLGWDPSALWGSKVDPLVVGEKDGKLYLIAAWG